MIVPLRAKILGASRAPLNTPISPGSLESFNLIFFYSLIENLKDI